MGKKKSAKIIDFSLYSGYSLNQNLKIDNNKDNNKREEENKKVKSKKRKRKKNTIINGKLLLFLLIIITVCCFCLFTPGFNVNKIIIQDVNKIEYVESHNYDVAEENTGNNHYTKQEIVDMSGIIIGTNIFKTSITQVEENIEKASYIKNATVLRVLPSTIRIEIEERTIVAYVDYIGAYMCIDETGYCVDSIKKESKKNDLPVIKGINAVDSTKGFTIGQILETDDNIKLQRLIYLLNLLKREELNLQIQEIDILDKENVIVIINNGDIKINFGDMSNMNTKIPFLPEILEDKQGKKGTIYMNSDSENIQPIFSELIGG